MRVPPGYFYFGGLNMNLLERFEKVTVEVDNRITSADRDFCEMHQQAYETAIQSFQELLFFWEDMEKRQKELLGESDSGQTNYSCYLFSSDGPSIDVERIHSHIESLHKTLIENIVHHFNSAYNVSASSTEIAVNLLPQKPDRYRDYDKRAREAYREKLRSITIRYQDVVDQIILFLGGRSFAEQAFHELAEKCHHGAWNLYQKRVEYEQKKNIIRFTGRHCSFDDWRSYEQWSLSNQMKDILRGIAHYETGSYDLYPYGFSGLLGYNRSGSNECEFSTCKKVKSLKMFKNGRVDVKFATEELASKFAEDYLGLVP